MPRVTVLLTCYNHLDFLSACLDSVRAQTYQDYEIIVLDDGSVDGTREYLARLPADPQMKIVLNEKNLGTYGTLNAGLHLAKGELVAILNDDDVWEPEKLAQQVDLLDANPRVGLVHTNGAFIDGSGARVEGEPLGFEFPRTETGDVYLDLVYANKIIASAVLVRRECFDSLGLFNPDYFGSGDWEMWLRIAEKWDVGYIDERLTYYRVHGTNASHNLEKIWKDDERLRIWLDERLAHPKKSYGTTMLQKARAHNLACLGTVLTLNGHPKAGRNAYARSLHLDPGRWRSRLRWVATFLPKSWFRRLL